MLFSLPLFPSSHGKGNKNAAETNAMILYVLIQILVQAIKRFQA